VSKKPIVYYLLKLNAVVKNHRIKFFVLWLFHTFNRRYFAINFDPILACNLRCKMCYFTDENYTKTHSGYFRKEELTQWAKQALPQALKLQVGCGTEPTVYKHLDTVFELGKQYKVPHISMTTNANLLEKEKLISWVKNGLNEITVSLHGVYKETYENLMQRGNYQKFLDAMQLVTEVKKQFPELVLRINYTFNEDNFTELNDFFKVYGNYAINIIQLRPISKIGDTAYKNFSLDKIIPVYDAFIQKFRTETSQRNITLLAPSSNENLIQRENDSSLIFNYTYFYVSPQFFWKDGFDWKNESFRTFTKRIKWGKQLFRNIFKSKKDLQHLLKAQNLNYDVDMN